MNRKNIVILLLSGFVIFSFIRLRQNRDAYDITMENLERCDSMNTVFQKAFQIQSDSIQVLNELLIERKNLLNETEN
jgi:hypothetical protein